jgi:uncharacterized protein (DUF885 family)
MPARFVVLLLVTVALACAPAREPEGPAASRALDALYEAEWEYTMREHPTYASLLGDRRYNDRWDDVSLAAIQRQHEHDAGVLRSLERFDVARLPPRDRLDYQLFRKDYELAVEEYAFHLHLLPINQRDGIQTSAELADALPFDTMLDYEQWLARLRSFPKYVDQTILLLREGIRTRVTHPRVIMERIPPQLDEQIVEDPTKSDFFAPYRHFSPQISVRDRASLSSAAQASITNDVVPAFKRLKAFFVREYLPACTDEVGAWQLPNGEALYRFLVRKHTTTALRPEQIHQTGLAEVARIRREMLDLAHQLGFRGTLKEFFAFLRTDPRFFYANENELFAAYAATAKRIDPLLVKLFRSLPRTPYGVEAIPAAIAPDTTTAYYREPADDGSRAGTYFVNLYKPEVRPKWEMMALTLHESVPGHHLQIALAMEQTAIPKFRRHALYTAFVEGWGLYAESLGEEMGLYDDPYAKFGQLAYEMWRAVRLVVDTGIHLYKWDRRRAIDYFLENCPKAELDVTNEVDRYIAWPGQALAYKTGELTIKRLRARAASELGRRFDVRDLHEVLLSDGALPLDVLEERVLAWIDRKKKSS